MLNFLFAYSYEFLCKILIKIIHFQILTPYMCKSNKKAIENSRSFVRFFDLEIIQKINFVLRT